MKRHSKPRRRFLLCHPYDDTLRKLLESAFRNSSFPLLRQSKTLYNHDRGLLIPSEL